MFSVRNEDELKYSLFSFLNTYICPSIKICDEQKHHNKIRAHLYSRKIKTHPDIIFECDNTPIMFIEIKTKYSLDPANNIVNFYKDNFKQRTNGNSGKICKCVDQLYSYMILDSINYGLLTSIDSSWFFEVKENQDLVVSNEIKNTQLHQFLLSIFNKQLSHFSVFKKTLSIEN